MRLIFAHFFATAMGLFGAGRLGFCSAETQLVMKDRSYYAWGYEGDTTEGVPNGCVLHKYIQCVHIGQKFSHSSLLC